MIVLPAPIRATRARVTDIVTDVILVKELISSEVNLVIQGAQIYYDFCNYNTYFSKIILDYCKLG